jgi:uncharacterized protein YjiS (DUF1127 family)
MPLEGAMPNSDSPPPKHPTLELVVEAIAAWVNKYRETLADTGRLSKCSPDEVNQIAKDIGVSSSQLQNVVAKGPGAADLLRKMLVALHVDPDVVAQSDLAVMRDLQRLCAACGHKGRCRHELAAGTAAEHFHEFCPNSYTLDSLFPEKAAAARH